MSTTFDVVILGAGLAGLSSAVALSDYGTKILVVEQKKLGSGASGVPLGLINPAAAKQANLSWNAESCVAAISELLERTHPFSEQVFYHKSGVLRPSVDAATLEAFSTSLKRHEYPSGWARWMEKDELESFQPGLVHAGGALWVNEGFTVDSRLYLTALSRLLLSAGVELALETQLQSLIWHDADHNWVLLLSDGRYIRTVHVLHATGSSIMDDLAWNWLPVHTIKGQMAMYTSKEKLDWTHAIAGRGYAAHLNGFDWAIGSTYEHRYIDESPDDSGLYYLEQKIDAMLPDLRARSSLISQWAGIRTGTPNRLPVVGPHPTLKGRWIFSGLGSKGLLYSAFLGKLLASTIVNGTQLPTEVSTTRFKTNV